MEHPALRIQVGVVLLAAGASSRMGRPKLLLPWGKTSVAGRIVGQWQEAGARQIAVVLRQHDAALQDELDRLHLPGPERIGNPAPERGMFSSIQCAAAWDGWAADLTHWAITLGDQPHLSSKTFRQLLLFAETHPDQVCQPEFEGKGRHPVVLPRAEFRRLAQSAAGSLREFLQQSSRPPARCPLADAGLALDLDTPAEYEEALRRFPV